MNSEDRNFKVGDRIQLTDAKGKMHTITLQINQEWHTHNGWIVHNDLIGSAEGTVIETTGGLKFLAFKPLLSDYVLAMPRGATIVYPKDAAMILGVADIAPGLDVLEAGVGSGALSISLLRAIGATGTLDSFERREEFSIIAEKNITNYFGGRPENWRLQLGAVQEHSHDKKYDRVVLDMLAPWECIDMASEVLVAGGVFIAYVATTTQLSQTAEAIKRSTNFTEPESSETIVRGWHHEGLAVRPQHRMIGHTAFLIMARRLAPGTIAPARRRRPSKGAYGTNESEA
mgnify:CR=1 FL=1